MQTIRPKKDGKFDVIAGMYDYFNLALGNSTMFRVGVLLTEEGGIFIGVEGKGAYTFGHFAHWTYVAEKLKLAEGDARNLADFINAQLHDEAFEIQGTYEANLCQK